MFKRFFSLAVVCSSFTGQAHAQTDVQTLQQQLIERDVLIKDLQRRVQVLEQRSRAGAALEPASQAQRLAVQDGIPPAPASASPAAATAATVPKPVLAAIASEEDESARALERALVREGGFVLAPKALEIEPMLQYTYNGARGPGIVQTPTGAQITERSTNQHRPEAMLGLRLGLPWSSQLEVRVPYRSVRSNTSAAAAGLIESERNSGLGDTELQFTKQFATEHGARPALLGALTWKPATGPFQLGQPSPGSGFASVQAGLTAVKRQDPLVFFGGISYTDVRARTYAGNSISPGNGFGIRVGTLLAASPETSLRAGLELSHFGSTKINGIRTVGSDLLSGIVELGLSSLVTKNTLIDLSIGFGVTPDAPKLRLGVSLPIRFN